MSKNAHRAAMRTLAEETLAVLHEIRDRMPERRPESCCGDCPPIAGGGYDCTCEGNPRCMGEDYPDAEGLAALRGEGDERCGRPEMVTVTLPRDVVGFDLRRHAHLLRRPGHEHDLTADVLYAMADALEAADTPPEPTTATQDAPAGRVGWLRFISGDRRRLLAREVEGGWSCDDNDLPDFYPSKHYPYAVFTPIATLPEGYVAVDREDLRAVLDFAATGDFNEVARRAIRHFRTALEGGQS